MEFLFTLLFVLLQGLAPQSGAQTTDLPDYASNWLTPAAQAEIDKGCTSYYDGCNTCQVNEDGSVNCTLRYCKDTPEVITCNEY